MSPFVTGFCWTWFRWSSVWVREDFSPKQLALWWSVLIIVAQGFFDSHVSQESKDQTTVTSNWFIGLPNIRRSICNPAAFYGHAVLEHMALLTQVGRAVLSHACSIVFHPQSKYIYIYFMFNPSLCQGLPRFTIAIPCVSLPISCRGGMACKTKRKVQHAPPSHEGQLWLDLSNSVAATVQHIWIHVYLYI